mmetsp:Transcript_23921/g.40110  ORF Transcript_23921/g.40110 Transcript_23921/m.40110 type:complete len:205 (-) Transcript_23921:289-903(-)
MRSISGTAISRDGRSHSGAAERAEHISVKATAPELVWERSGLARDETVNAAVAARAPLLTVSATPSARGDAAGSFPLMAAMHPNAEAHVALNPTSRLRSVRTDSSGCRHFAKAESRGGERMETSVTVRSICSRIRVALAAVLVDLWGWSTDPVEEEEEEEEGTAAICIARFCMRVGVWGEVSRDLEQDIAPSKDIAALKADSAC